jgi:phage repressor protein C with HTH and peptisase S24 domain
VTLHGVDTLVQAVRQRIEMEGLRPFAMRTGIPLGQLRSVVQGRAARYTTLQSIASVLGMQLFIGPAESGGAEAPQLPREITRALHLPSDAGVLDAVGLIDKDAMALKMREGMRAVQELTQRAAVAAELLPRLAGESPATRMMPFAAHVRFKADTGEVEFEESADLSIAVAEKVLPPWARTDHLTCVRAAGDSMEPTIRDGDLVVVDQDQRIPVDDQLFVVRTGGGVIVRRLHRIGDHWHLVGDNLGHLSRPMAADDRIVGRVAWCGPHSDAVA